MKFFLDLDGVLADFDGGLEEWYGITIGEEERQKWEYDYDTHGISENDFWSGLTYDFWANLAWTSEGKEIYELVEKYDPVILTSPPWSSPNAVYGKASWIKRNRPDIWKEKRFFFGSKKFHIAHNDAVLIDDNDDNVGDFSRAGGWEILVPRPWNSLRGLDTIEHIRFCLNRIIPKSQYERKPGEPF